MSSKIRKKRLSLWEKNKKCYWCSCETVFPPANFDVKGKFDNLATIDHLRSKFNPKRKSPNLKNERRLVLSCQKCNYLRSYLESLAQEDFFLLYAEFSD